MLLTDFLPRDAIYKRGIYAVRLCLFVCPLVRFVYSLKTSNQILKPFSLSGSYTILVCITFGGGTRALNTGGIGKWPLSWFGIDDWWIVVHSFDHRVKCITADDVDSSHRRKADYTLSWSVAKIGDKKCCNGFLQKLLPTPITSVAYIYNLNDIYSMQFVFSGLRFPGKTCFRV